MLVCIRHRSLVSGMCHRHMQDESGMVMKAAGIRLATQHLIAANVKVFQGLAGNYSLCQCSAALVPNPVAS